MIKDAEAHADEAHRLRELADARNHAETLAYQTEKSPQGAPRQARRVGRRHDRGADHGARGRCSRATDVAEIRDEDGRAPGGVRSKLAAGRLRTGVGRRDRRRQRRGDGEATAADDEVIEDADYEVVDEDETAKTS